MLSNALGKCPFPATVGAEGNGGGRRRKLFHPAAPSPVPLPCSIRDFCTWDVQQILISAAQSCLSSPAWSCLLLSCVLVWFFLNFYQCVQCLRKGFFCISGAGNPHLYCKSLLWELLPKPWRSQRVSGGIFWALEAGEALRGYCRDQSCSWLSLSALMYHWKIQEITITSWRLDSLHIKWCE